MNVNKKGVLLFVFGVLLIVALIGLIHAASITEDLGTFMDGTKDVLSMFFEKILGSEAAGSDVFFQRVLILLVVFGIVYSILDKIDIFASNGFLLFLTSSAVSILGIRFLDDGFIQTILVPYGALGASIAIFLPILIYFTFVHTSVKGSFARRFAWLLYLFVLVAIWFVGKDLDNSSSWIYIAAMGFVLISVFFDPNIHKYFGMVGASRDRAYWNTNRKADIMRRLQEADKHHDAGRLTDAEYNSIKKKLTKSLKEALSNM